MALNLTDRQYYAAFNATNWGFLSAYEVGDVVIDGGLYYVNLIAVESTDTATPNPRPSTNPMMEVMGVEMPIWELIEGAVDALGENRFISLEDIINNYMVMYVDDDMHGSSKRIKIEAFAQRVIQEFSYDTFKVKELEFEILDLPRVVMPKDFVELVQLNYVDPYGQERWMVERKDSSNPLSVEQSNSGSPIVDSDDNLLVTNDSLTKERYDAAGETTQSSGFVSYDQNQFWYGKRYYLNTEKASSAYTYVINEHQGVIEVDPRLLNPAEYASGRDPLLPPVAGVVVLRYVSDGLSSDLSEVKVHKFAEQAIYEAIYYEDIARKVNVPANEKDRAKRRMKGKMKQTKLRLMNISPRDLLQTLRAQAQWIKT